MVYIDTNLVCDLYCRGVNQLKKADEPYWPRRFVWSSLCRPVRAAIQNDFINFALTKMEWEFKGEQLILLPEKALYWRDRKTLIVADLHIGKAGHFRKAGIAVPRHLEQEDLAVLSDLIVKLRPERLIFLGDLFHSEMNNDWQWLKMWRDLYPRVSMILVRGNHDILSAEYYRQADFEVFDTLREGPFTFVHEPPADPDGQAETSGYYLSGHIHPAVRLKGKGRQSVILPCFYFGEKLGVLPAFGRFTGNCCIRGQNAFIFGVLNNTVVKL